MITSTLVKVCRECGDEKSVEEFYKRSEAKDGRRNDCKTCVKGHSERSRRNDPDRVNESIRRSKARNPEKYREMTKRWVSKHPERSRAIKRRWVSNNGDKIKGKDLMYKYGMTLQDYEEMLVDQEHKCALCGEPLEDSGKRHPIDHDHKKTGRESVRGIVHQRCNIFLGFVDNYPGILVKAKRYLERYSKVGSSVAV